MIRKKIAQSLALAAVTFACTPGVSQASYFLDRWYKMGDQSGEGAVAGNTVTLTYNTLGVSGNFRDLTGNVGANATGVNYVDISAARPVAGNTTNNLAVSLDGTDDFLSGAVFANPAQSEGAGVNGYGSTINDRGFQLWFRPDSIDGVAEAIIDDGDRFGARINNAGLVAAETNNVNNASTTTVLSNSWYHVMQVRPAGTIASVTYVNGRVGPSQPGNYDLNNATAQQLVVGANVEPPAIVGDPAVTDLYFDGTVDDLQMFAFGAGFGTFNYTTDNGYFTDVFLPSQNAFYSYVHNASTGHNNKLWIAGDMNFDGTFNQADVTAFVSGWLSRQVDLPGTGSNSFGDYATLAAGDLDLDGDTDLGDWIRLRQIAAGGSVVLPSLGSLGAVPEPATVLLAGSGIACGLTALRRRRK